MLHSGETTPPPKRVLCWYLHQFDVLTVHCAEGCSCRVWHQKLLSHSAAEAAKFPFHSLDLNMRARAWFCDSVTSLEASLGLADVLCLLIKPVKLPIFEYLQILLRGKTCYWKTLSDIRCYSKKSLFIFFHKLLEMTFSRFTSTFWGEIFSPFEILKWKTL